MKERPILFSGAMVRAILKGSKTQTRRVVKGLPEFCGGAGEQEDAAKWGWMNEDRAGPKFQSLVDSACPYGVPGDRLWVRETHQVCAACRHVNCRADEQQHGECSLCGEGLGKWRPSIFMRREFSRITLEVVSVRVERLQDISEADAMAEGVESVAMPTGEVMYEDYLERGALVARAVSSYATLWDRINGEGAWSLNPWVWLVEFRKTAEWGQQKGTDGKNGTDGFPVSKSHGLLVSKSDERGAVR